MSKTIKITQTKSSIGRHPKHIATLASLGLRGIGHSVEKGNTPSIKGMIKSVYYMVKVEE